MSVYALPADPTVRRPDPRGPWVLVDGFEVFDGARRFAIPAGFECDMASIPRAARVAMETTDLGIVAPSCHDYLYRYGGAGLYTRADADRLFRDLMAWDGVPWWRRWTAYAAVRVGGWAAWRPQYVPAL